MKRYTKIAAELVVSPRDVLETRPRSSPPPSMSESHPREPEEHRDRDDEDWDNGPCTD